MTIVALRHLPTEWNVQGRLQGRRDVPIAEFTAETAQQVAAVRSQLEERGPFDLVVTSPLLRTRQTAETYGFTEFTVDPLLLELDFGPFEGRTRAELLESHSEEWLTNPATLTLGEPLLDLQARVVEFLGRHDQATFGTTLLIGHGAWIRALLSVVEHGSIQRMNTIELGNNSLRVITPDRHAV